MAINLTNGSDTYSGTAGDDVVNGKQGDDTLSGGAGDDTLNGQQDNDNLYGDGGDDVLNGQEGIDGLSGGEGNDTLDGGSAADTFNYSFSVATGTAVSFSGWLADNGWAPLVDSTTTQNYFSTKYTAWLEWLVETYALGEDLDGDGIEVGLNQNSEGGAPHIEGMAAEELEALFADRQAIDLVTGRTTQERWYSDTFGSGSTEITSTDGNDVVKDFSRSQGDKLDFSGLTSAQFVAFFDWEVVDADADGAADDTMITLSTDDTWSLTLIGVTNFDHSLDVVFSA
jgi:Ca2+-binding RTX toxin-like protein